MSRIQSHEGLDVYKLGKELCQTYDCIIGKPVSVISSPTPWILHQNGS